MKHKLYYIKWCDAIHNESSWMTEKEAIEWAQTDDWVVTQVGWVIEETEKYIVLVTKLSTVNSDTEQQLGGVYKIPTTWILERNPLTFTDQVHGEYPNKTYL